MSKKHVIRSKQKADCPTWLNADGQQCWKAFMTALKGRFLNEVESNIMAGAAQEWSLFIQASKTIHNGDDYFIQDAQSLANTGSRAYQNFLTAGTQLGIIGQRG